MKTAVAAILAFTTCAAATFVALERQTVPPMQPTTAAVVDQVCGFGGMPMKVANETVAVVAEAIQAEPILKRARICAVLAYQPTERN